MKMNEVIKAVAQRAGVSQKTSDEVLHAFKDVVLDAVVRKDRISWNGFFSVHYYIKKVSYKNRTTGERVKYDCPKVKFNLCKNYRNVE